MGDERATEVEVEVRHYAEVMIESVPPVTADEARERVEHRRGPPGVARWLALAAAVVLVAGVAAVLVSSGDGEEETKVAAGDFPLTLDGHRDWFLRVMNGHVPSDAELEERLALSFLQAIPSEEFRQVFDSVHAGAPWRTIREIERREQQTLAVQVVDAEGDQSRLSFAVGGEGKIVHAVVLAAVPCGEVIPPDDVDLAPPLAQRLEWLWAAANGETDPSEEEIASVLHPSFMAPVEFRSGLQSLRTLGPLTKRHYEDRPTDRALFLRVGINSGEEARLSLHTEREAPHRITGFSFLTQQPCRLPTP